MHKLWTLYTYVHLFTPRFTVQVVVLLILKCCESRAMRITDWNKLNSSPGVFNAQNLIKSWWSLCNFYRHSFEGLVDIKTLRAVSSSSIESDSVRWTWAVSTETEPHSNDIQTNWIRYDGVPAKRALTDPQKQVKELFSFLILWTGRVRMATVVDVLSGSAITWRKNRNRFAFNIVNLESIGYAPVMELHESTIEGSAYTHASNKQLMYKKRLTTAAAEEKCASSSKFQSNLKHCYASNTICHIIPTNFFGSNYSVVSVAAHLH